MSDGVTESELAALVSNISAVALGTDRAISNGEGGLLGGRRSQDLSFGKFVRLFQGVF